MIFAPPENATLLATIAVQLVEVVPFENDKPVVGKYKLPVSCMLAPPANVASLAEVIALSSKNSTPAYGPVVGADSVMFAPLLIDTEPYVVFVPVR